MSNVSQSSAGNCVKPFHQSLHLFHHRWIRGRCFPLRPGLRPHLLKRQHGSVVEPAQGRDVFQGEATFGTDCDISLVPICLGAKYPEQLIPSSLHGERARGAKLSPQSLLPLPDGFVDRLCAMSCANEEQNLRNVVVRVRASVECLGGAGIDVAAKVALVVLDFRNRGARLWASRARDWVRPHLAFEEQSPFSAGNFKNGIGQDKAVWRGASVPEVLLPRKSNRIGRNPAELSLPGARIAAAGRHDERNVQLVEHDGVLTKGRTDVVFGNLDDGIQNGCRQSVARACQRPHLAAFTFVRPIKETSNEPTLEREGALSSKAKQALSHVVDISPVIEQPAELLGGKVTYDSKKPNELPVSICRSRLRCLSARRLLGGLFLMQNFIGVFHLHYSHHIVCSVELI